MIPNLALLWWKIFSTEYFITVIVGQSLTVTVSHRHCHSLTVLPCQRRLTSTTFDLDHLYYQPLSTMVTTFGSIVTATATTFSLTTFHLTTYAYYHVLHWLWCNELSITSVPRRPRRLIWNASTWALGSSRLHLDEALTGSHSRRLRFLEGRMNSRDRLLES